MMLLTNPCHHHQNIRANHCHKSDHAKNLLLRFPALAVLQPFQKEILERIRRFLVGEAVVDVLIVRVRFEPQLEGVREEYQTEEEENEYKSKGRFVKDGHYLPGT